MLFVAITYLALQKASSCAQYDVDKKWAWLCSSETCNRTSWGQRWPMYHSLLTWVSGLLRKLLCLTGQFRLWDYETKSSCYGEFCRAFPQPVLSCLQYMDAYITTDLYCVMRIAMWFSRSGVL